MKQLKFCPLLLLWVLITLSSCDKEETAVDPGSTENLDQVGILGKWGLQSITINGITDMIVHYDSLEFTTGIETNDLIGDFLSSDAIVNETNGQFEIDTINNVILFYVNSSVRSYEYEISSNWLALTYSENNINIIEDWIRKE